MQNHRSSNRVQVAVISSSCDEAPPSVDGGHVLLLQQQLQQQQQQQQMQQQLELEQLQQQQQQLQAQRQQQLEEQQQMLQIAVQAQPPPSPPVVQPLLIAVQHLPPPSSPDHHHPRGHRRHHHHRHHRRHRHREHRHHAERANNEPPADNGGDDTSHQRRRRHQQPRRPPAPTPHFECIICDVQCDTAAAHRRHQRSRSHRDSAQRAAARQLARRFCLTECRVLLPRLTDAEVERACRSVDGTAPPKVRRGASGGGPLPSAMRRRRPALQLHLAALPDSSSSASAGVALPPPPHQTPPPPTEPDRFRIGHGRLRKPHAVAVAQSYTAPRKPYRCPAADCALGLANLYQLNWHCRRCVPDRMPPPRRPCDDIGVRKGKGDITDTAVATDDGNPRPGPMRRRSATISESTHSPVVWRESLAVAERGRQMRTALDGRKWPVRIDHSNCNPLHEDCTETTEYMMALMTWYAHSRLEFIETHRDRRLQWESAAYRHSAIGVRMGGCRRPSVMCLCGGSRVLAPEVLKKMLKKCLTCKEWFSKDVNHESDCSATSNPRHMMVLRICRTPPKLRRQPTRNAKRPHWPRQILQGCSKCTLRTADTFPCAFCPLYFDDNENRSRHNRIRHPDEEPSLVAFVIPPLEECM